MAKRFVSYRHTFINSIGTFFSRITGVLKQNVVSYLFGAAQDPFWLSFRLVNSFRRYIGEGAMTSAFIPVFQKKLSENPEENKDHPAFLFANNVINLFLLINLLLVILGALFAPLYAPLLVPGYKKGSPELTQNIWLTVIMMPYLIFISLYAIFMGVLNSHKKFTASAFAPVFFNIAFILFPIFLIHHIGIYSLGIAVVAGVILMVIAQFFELYQVGFRYRFILNFKDPALKDFFRLFSPTALNMVVLTVKNYATTFFLSFFIGSAMVYMNSYLIIEAPLGIIGIAIGTVIMPLLSRFNVEKNTVDFQKSMVEGFYLLFYFMVPVSFFFFLYNDTVCNSVFRDIMRFVTGGTGKYTAALFLDTYKTVAIYSLALLPMGAVIIFEKVFYSLHDAKTPLRANIIIFILSFGIYFTTFIPSIGYFGVFIADTIAAWMTLAFYAISLNKKLNLGPVFKGLLYKLLFLIVFSAIASAAIYPFHQNVYLHAQTPLQALAFAASEFGIFSALYYIITKIFRMDLKK